MKSRTEVRSKGPRTRKISPQQAAYELKHRVVSAINKAADRDTYQIGVQELEKTAESLSPDGIIPFLSCILDSDSEQKATVRKECVRMMGVIAKIHRVLIGPHLGRMVASIVKRLKDQDSVVRETCVETMGVLASEYGNRQVESDGVFVLLVRPLFEALGEQNKQIQAGAAMCLARVIDNMNEPPVSILQKMLTRTMKLLKNPHLMAKPAVIDLNKSLIQAGGALSHSALSTAICSIQDTLKDTDWTTRKAAAVALGEIGTSGGPFLAPFKNSCVQTLETCRFDKVKPVRDAVSLALRCWKCIEGLDTPETSDMVSSVKDSICRDDCSDHVSAGSSMWKDIGVRESGNYTIKKRAPVSTRKASPNYDEACNKSINSEWQIDIAIPKTQTGMTHIRNEESESSSGGKTQETITVDVMSMQDIGQEYNLMDDKQEHSSASNNVSDNFTNRFASAVHRDSDINNSVNSAGRDRLLQRETYSSEVPPQMLKIRDRSSLDSTLTEVEECHPSFRVEGEISAIRKQLFEIEKKQSSLMDLVLGFTTTTMESLSVIQLKVSSLEHAVEKISQDLVQGSKFAGKCHSSASGISTSSTPRPLVDMKDKRTSARPSRNIELWEGKTAGPKSKCNFVSECADSRRLPLSMMNRNSTGLGSEKCTKRDQQDMNRCQSRNASIFTPVSHSKAKQSVRVNENDIWKCVKGFLCEGDLESAYREALYSGDLLLLVELIDGTGPVLDGLSNRTISDLLTALASCVLEHRIVDSVIPWLQQIVDLSAVHGPNCIPLSAKVRREILSAVQEALDVEVTHPARRRLVAQLAMKLQQIWALN